MRLFKVTLVIIFISILACKNHQIVLPEAASVSEVNYSWYHYHAILDYSNSCLSFKDSAIIPSEFLIGRIAELSNADYDHLFIGINIDRHTAWPEVKSLFERLRDDGPLSVGLMVNQMEDSTYLEFLLSPKKLPLKYHFDFDTIKFESILTSVNETLFLNGKAVKQNNRQNLAFEIANSNPLFFNLNPSNSYQEFINMLDIYWEGIKHTQDSIAVSMYGKSFESLFEHEKWEVEYETRSHGYLLRWDYEVLDEEYDNQE